MALVDTYDRNKPLQDQVDFPIQAEGLELILERNTKNGPKFLVKKDRQTTQIAKGNAVYLAILMTDGYATRDELFETLYEGDLESSIVQYRIRRLRKIVGKGIIKTEHTSENGIGGYYIGELSNHRNEERHLKRYNGSELNTLTRYIKPPNGNSTHLKGVETRIMEVLFENGGNTSASLVAQNLYGVDGDYEIKAVYDNVNRINKRMHGEYIKGDALGNLTLTNTNI